MVDEFPGVDTSMPNGPWDPGGEYYDKRNQWRREDQLEYIRGFDGHPERPKHGMHLYDKEPLADRVVQRVMLDGVRKVQDAPRQDHTEYALHILGDVSGTEVSIDVQYVTDTYRDKNGDADGYGAHLVVTDSASNKVLFERKGSDVTTYIDGPWLSLFPIPSNPAASAPVSGA